MKPLLYRTKKSKNAEYVTFCWEYVSIKVNMQRAGSMGRSHDELKIKKKCSKIKLNYG